MSTVPHSPDALAATTAALLLAIRRRFYVHRPVDRQHSSESVHVFSDRAGHRLRAGFSLSK
jgi:hypothetical protein